MCGCRGEKDGAGRLIHLLVGSYRRPQRLGNRKCLAMPGGFPSEEECGEQRLCGLRDRLEYLTAFEGVADGAGRVANTDSSGSKPDCSYLELAMQVH